MGFCRGQTKLSRRHYSCRPGPKKVSIRCDSSDFILPLRYEVCKIWISVKLTLARLPQEKFQYLPSTTSHNCCDGSSTPNSKSNHPIPLLWFRNEYPTPRQILYLNCSLCICRLQDFSWLVMFRLGTIWLFFFSSIVSLSYLMILSSSIKSSLCLILDIHSFKRRTEILKRFLKCAEVKRFGKWPCNTFYLFPT